MNHKTFALILFICLAGCTSVLAPSVDTQASALRDGAYRLDPAHSTLLFKISHFGISTYVGRFNTFQATLEFDENNPQNSFLEAVIDVTSLDVNNPTFADTLKGPNWFDAENFPEARFVATQVTITGDNTGDAVGNLTIKGITRPAILNVTFNGGTRNKLTTRYTIGFDGRASFTRSEFDIELFSAFVGDRVDLEFYGEFQRQ